MPLRRRRDWVCWNWRRNSATGQGGLVGEGAGGQAQGEGQALAQGGEGGGGGDPHPRLWADAILPYTGRGELEARCDGEQQGDGVCWVQGFQVAGFEAGQGEVQAGGDQEQAGFGRDERLDLEAVAGVVEQQDQLFVVQHGEVHVVKLILRFPGVGPRGFQMRITWRMASGGDRGLLAGAEHVHHDLTVRDSGLESFSASAKARADLPMPPSPRTPR